MSKKKFKVVTLGCRTNQYEAQAYADQLRAMGYEEASSEERAELCIVNTCTVTQNADRDSKAQIRQLAKRHPDAKLVVTGCLAQRAPDEIRSIVGVTHVIANAKKERLLEEVFPEEEIPEFAITEFTAHTRAFVKVQDGCNSFCTYCIIPYVRGRSRSRSIDDIVKEVVGLIENGYKEVVLTGINIGDYEDDGKRLVDLVKIVDKIAGLKRLRISSIDPDEVDEALAAAVLEGKNTCPSMHIVLQSGSNAILKRMNRKYTRQIFLNTVEYLRSKNPDFTFTTDVIVGFPGETDLDFEETLAVIKEVRFARVHMFPYSERKQTRAALFPNKVPHALIQERKQRVLRLAEEVAFDLRNDYIGRTLEVLLESEGEGHTVNFLKVIAPGKINELVTVKCTQNSPEGLTSQCV